MEPSVITITINKEIRFKKTDLEALKDSSENNDIVSDEYRACSMLNVKYYLSICPNGDEDSNREETWIFLYVETGRATKVEADIDCTVESSGFSTKIKRIYEVTAEWGSKLCTTEEFFDPSMKFFIIDEMVVKVKGSLKIYLPVNIIFFPISAQWTIKKSDLEAIKDSTDDSENILWSKVFQFPSKPNIQYSLLLRPNGREEYGRGTACIFLYVNFGITIPKVGCIYNFSIETANCSIDLEHMFKGTESWGIDICSTEDLFDHENEYFIDGEMVVKINGALTIKKKKSTISKRVEQCPSFKAMQTYGETDFSIIVGDKPCSG